jgi:hypothetical protein
MGHLLSSQEKHHEIFKKLTETNLLGLLLQHLPVLATLAERAGDLQTDQEKTLVENRFSNVQSAFTYVFVHGDVEVTIRRNNVWNQHVIGRLVQSKRILHLLYYLPMRRTNGR